MGKQQTFISSTALRKISLIFAAVAMLITFAVVSAPAGATSKNQKPQTDAQKIAAAAAWAKATVRGYAPIKSNPNPKGLAPGVGLQAAYARTPAYLALNEYTRFLEKARGVTITEEMRKNRSKVIYTRYHKARAFAFSRSVQRRGIAKSYINKERRTEVQAAESKYAAEVLNAKRTFQQSRTEVQNFRKNKAGQIERQARRSVVALRKKIRKAKRGGNRAKLRGQVSKVRENRKAKHTTNALRYSIKIAFVTSVRDARIAEANKVLATEVQTAEDRAARRTDANMAFINNRTGVEVTLATTWRQRAVHALQATKHRVVKQGSK